MLQITKTFQSGHSKRVKSRETSFDSTNKDYERNRRSYSREKSAAKRSNRTSQVDRSYERENREESTRSDFREHYRHL